MRRLLEHAIETRVLKERIHHRRLRISHPVHDPVRLHSPQQLGLHQRRWRLERIGEQELHRLHLPGSRNGRESHAVLADVFLLRLDAADDLHDMVHLDRPLRDHPSVDLGQLVVRIAHSWCVVAAISISDTRAGS